MAVGRTSVTWNIGSPHGPSHPAILVDETGLSLPSSDGAGAAGDQALLLFRAGRRAEALPWLERAAAEGDARAQYLLGVALFNGDGGAPDLDRARDLLGRAAEAGLEQAAAALAAAENATVPPGRDLLVSAEAVRSITGQLARLERPRPQAGTMDALVIELLLPLMRERLETALPAAFAGAVEGALQSRAAASDQPMPVRS